MQEIAFGYAKSFVEKTNQRDFAALSKQFTIHLEMKNIKGTMTPFFRLIEGMT